MQPHRYCPDTRANAGYARGGGKPEAAIPFASHAWSRSRTAASARRAFSEQWSDRHSGPGGHGRPPPFPCPDTRGTHARLPGCQDLTVRIKRAVRFFPFKINSEGGSKV